MQESTVQQQHCFTALHSVCKDATGMETHSSSSSFTESSIGSSDFVNWEEHVSTDGTLFYVEYMPQLRKVNDPQQKCIQFTRSSSLRIGKKPKARKQQQQYRNINDQAANKKHEQKAETQDIYKEKQFKFSDINLNQMNNFKGMELVICTSDRYRFGHHFTAVESILGFAVLPFPDQPECLMFDRFVHDLPAMKKAGPRCENEFSIKRGDWFRALDNIDIRAKNIDDILLQFSEPTKVLLHFHRPKETEKRSNFDFETHNDVAEMDEILKIESYAKFVAEYEKLKLPTDSATLDVDDSTQSVALPFALLILPPECYQHDKYKDSMYYYPENSTTNFLYKTRGSFLTLNAVLIEELNTKPLTSKLLVENVQYYVCYRALNGFLVLFAYAAAYQQMSECSLRSDELIRYVRFSFPYLSLDNFSCNNASVATLRQFLKQFCEIQSLRIMHAHKNHHTSFEELLSESRFLPLPKEAQLRIFDALSEMEAMDYRNWNDDPLNTYREYFIFGSAVYYDHFLIASQISAEMRANVECFLRCRGIFEFIAVRHVKEVYVWEEITIVDETGRYFLAICGRSHLLLVVILKMFDAPDLSANSSIPPSLFYIEEMQETLDHLIQCGIESLAMLWSVSNKRPEIAEATDKVNAAKDSTKLETFFKHKLAITSSPTAVSAAAFREASCEQYTQQCTSLAGSSIHSLTPSEDDLTKKRITTFNVTATADDSDSGGSDWENFGEQSHLQHSLDPETQSQLTESLWKEISSILPIKLSAGWKNSLYYYIDVDSGNGSVFCPLKPNFESHYFLREMRKACHLIHGVLQKSKQFLSQETKTASSNRGTLAITEHGVSIQLRDANDGYLIKETFVVVGRLFSAPTREVYVCHHPRVPQNILEMAFRLSFFSVG